MDKIFFDIEGLDKILNPEETSNDKSGLEYLLGFTIMQIKKNLIYIWAHNQKEEKNNFKIS